MVFWRYTGAPVIVDGRIRGYTGAPTKADGPHAFLMSVLSIIERANITAVPHVAVEVMHECARWQVGPPGWTPPTISVVV